MGKDNNDEKEQSKPRAFESIEERLERRRRKAPTSRLITYIIILILVIVLILWLRSFGRFY